MIPIKNQELRVVLPKAGLPLGKARGQGANFQTHLCLSFLSYRAFRQPYVVSADRPNYEVPVQLLCILPVKRREPSHHFTNGGAGRLIRTCPFSSGYIWLKASNLPCSPPSVDVLESKFFTVFVCLIWPVQYHFTLWFCSAFVVKKIKIWVDHIGTCGILFL